MKSKNTFCIWMYLLANVAFEPTDAMFCGKKISLNPGQGVFKTPEIAGRWAVSISTAKRTLDALETEGQIEQQKSNKGTLVTVVNWEYYQQSEQQSEQQVNNKRTTDEQQMNNLPIKERSIRIKEVKNIPKVKYAEFVSMTEAEHQKLLETYGEADTQELIEILDNYKGSKGKTYKNDYRAILSWVVKALTERRAKSGMARGPKKDDTAPCPDAMYGATVV